MAAPIQDKFEAAVKVIHSLPKDASSRKMPGSFQPSYDLMLKFYAYYKQATLGKCNISKPSFWDVVGKAKWNAWNDLGDMPREVAMENYVDEMKKQFSIHYNEQIIEVMPHTEVVQDFIEKLGHFYELVEEKPLVSQKKVANGSVSVGADDSPSKTEPETDISTGDSESPSSDAISIGHMNDLNIAEIETSAVHSSFPVRVGAKLNGGGLVNGYHDDSSDGEEFCDTSDSPDSQHVISRINGNGIDQYEYVPSVEEFQTRIKSVGGSGPDLNDNEYCNSDYTRSAGQASAMGSSDITDAVMSRGGGETQGDTGDRNFHRVPSSSSVTNTGRGSVLPAGARGRSQFVASGGSGGGGREQGRSPGPHTDISEQIAVALVRLQQDMNSVLTRLNTLETLSLAQNQQMNRRREDSGSSDRERQQVNPWWWPFPNINSRAVFFILVWPFIVQSFLAFLARRRNRGRRP